MTPAPIQRVAEQIELSPRVIDGATRLWRGHAVEVCPSDDRLKMGATVAAAAAIRGRVHWVTPDEASASQAALFFRDFLAPCSLDVGLLGEKRAHRCGIVAGSWPRFARDYLRDQRAPGAAQQATRSSVLLIVDGLDTVALDSGPQVHATLGGDPDPQNLFAPVTRAVETLVRELHFHGNGPTVAMTDEGYDVVEAKLRDAGVLRGALHDGEHDLLLDVVLTCVHATTLRQGVDYVLRDACVVVLDQGAPCPERRFPFGLHHAVEARERVPMSPSRVIWGRCTFRGFARRYRARAGLLTSAVGIEEELRRRFGMSVSRMERVHERRDHDDVVHADREAQDRALAQDANAARAAGRCVLVRSSGALPALPEAARGASWTVLSAGRALEARHDEHLVGLPGDVDIETRFHLCPEDALFDDGAFAEMALARRARRCQQRHQDRLSTMRAASARLELYLEEQQVAFYGWRQRIVLGRGRRDAPPAYVHAIERELERVDKDVNQLYARFGVWVDAEEALAHVIAAGLHEQRRELHTFIGVVMRDVVDEARDIAGGVPDSHAIAEAHQILTRQRSLAESNDPVELAGPFHERARHQMQWIGPRAVLRHFRLLRLHALDRAWRDHLVVAMRLRDPIAADARAKGRPFARHRARLFRALGDGMADARSRIATSLFASLDDDGEGLRDRCQTLRATWND